MKLFSKIFKLVRYLYAYIIIPRGVYCYGINRGKMRLNRDGSYSPRYKICPYWNKNKDKPNQCNGYCGYLKQGDWDSEGLSLLWDQVKECGLKTEDYD